MVRFFLHFGLQLLHPDQLFDVPLFAGPVAFPSGKCLVRDGGVLGLGEFEGELGRLVALRKQGVGFGLGDRLGGVASFGDLAELSGRVAAALLQTADILVAVQVGLSVYLEFVYRKELGGVLLDLEPLGLTVL